MIISVFRREIHLVDNLKTNMLIDNDIIDFEDFDINMTKRETIIESIDVIISLKVRSLKSAIHKSVHLKKTIVVSSHVAIVISVHHVDLSITRDFLFESNDELNLIMYVHLVDSDIRCVMMRNDKDQSIRIFKNYQLNRIFEIDYSNAFHFDSYVDDDLTHLTVKEFKITHRDEWFKKLIFACVVIYAVAVVVETDSFSITFVSSSLIILSKLSHLSQAFVSEKFFVSEIVLSNDVIVYNFEINDFFAKIVDEFSILWHDIDFAKLSQENWMRILLKVDWESKISDKTKIYSLKIRDRELINRIFDDFHDVDKIIWINQSTFFSYSVFCVWKIDENDERKSRAIINIRELNVITQSNVYSLSLQSDIIVVVRDCKYISIIDCSAFFYQWRVHSNDRHKLTVINHCDQKSFNVTIMKYKNSSTYVQRQIDRFFRKLRKFVKAYVDDIVIFSRIKVEHETHLRDVFKILIESNISIKSTKTFLNYSFVSLLNQKIDSLNLITSEEKLRAISKLRFSRTFHQLKTYFDLIDWLRDYISYYAEVFKSLQEKKIELLRDESTIENARKTYSSKTRVQYFTTSKRISFDALQTILTKSFYLIHSNIKRQLFIDLNVSKKFDFEIMLYYVKKIYLKNSQQLDKYSSRHVIKSVLFLSRLVINVESKYWSIELEIVDIVWVLKKIKHIVEVSSSKTIMYTDHDSALNIVNQIMMTTTSTNKFNLRLVRISNYIQRFNLNIRHKFDKQHIVFDALSRLVSDNINASIDRNVNDEKLNALFIASLIEIDEVFRKRIVEDYKTNLNWQKIVSILNNDDENVTKLSFYRRKNEFIFRSEFTIDDHVYESHRLCISHSMIQNILQLIHDDDHSDYVKCFEQISTSYYIRDLSRYLRDYLKHCSNCQIYQIKKHAFYESMQSILFSSISFHTIIIDFILILFVTFDELNTSMSITCKYTKRLTFIVDKKIWSTDEWDMILIDRFDIANWNISKVIISDRDRKFLFDMWTKIFKKLDVRLLYSIVYHSQIDDQFERINQMIEIAFRFHLAKMTNFENWFKILSKMQRHFNNFTFVTIDKTLNETSYDFISIQLMNVLRQLVVIDLIDELRQSFELTTSSRKSFANVSFSIVIRIRSEIADVIAFAQMTSKYYYDRKHQSLFMKTDDYVLIRLHHDYNISSTKVLDSKLNQQYIDFFKILEKIDNLIYKLKLSKHWRIHSILFVVQLESTFSSFENSFRRSRSNHSDFVHVENDIKLIKSWKIDRLINKREIKRRESEYLIRWKNYESQYDEWRNLFELRNAQNLVKNYEDALQFILFLSERFQLQIISSSIQKSKIKSDRLKKTINDDISSVDQQKSVAKSTILVDQKLVVVARKFFADFTFFNNQFVTFTLLMSSNRKFVVVIKKLFAKLFISSLTSNIISSTFVVVASFADQLVRRSSRSQN